LVICSSVTKKNVGPLYEMVILKSQPWCFLVILHGCVAVHYLMASLAPLMT